MSRELATRTTAEESIPWVNATGEEIWDDSAELGGYLDKAARELASWVKTTRGGNRPSIFNRAAYVAPDNPYAQMQTARSAIGDDVVGGVADVTEGLAFQGVKWESETADDADVFNQISRDLNLDQFVRQWHREDFTYSQVVVGVWWTRKTYTVRGRAPVPVEEPATGVPVDPAQQQLAGGQTPPPKKKGPKRKKKYDVVVPAALTLLDPQKVVPLRPGPFGQDRLAWHAGEEEYAMGIAGEAAMLGDPVLAQFTSGPVSLSRSEEDYLSSLGINPKRLLLLNPRNVWRYTRTKPHYERFPENRLMSVFPLLDMKQQLMEADRVALVGAANYILLVKQGSKEEPAKQEEIDNLKENFKVLAKLPVIIGDHRLNIEIVTPAQDHVLDAKKYDAIDKRILQRTLGALNISTSGTREGASSTLARGIARHLENGRHMMKRELERELARAIVDHPMNDGKFEDEPNLTFTPRNVQLDTDQATLNAILSLRTQNELSRESTLEYFGFDQAVEALRRDFEALYFDGTFKTQVPFASPAMGGATDDQGNPVSSQVSGQQGGRPQGGGDSPQSVKGRNGKGRTSNGNPSTKES